MIQAGGEPPFLLRLTMGQKARENAKSMVCCIQTRAIALEGTFSVDAKMKTNSAVLTSGKIHSLLNAMYANRGYPYREIYGHLCKGKDTELGIAQKLNIKQHIVSIVLVHLRKAGVLTLLGKLCLHSEYTAIPYNLIDVARMEAFTKLHIAEAAFHTAIEECSRYGDYAKRPQHGFQKV